MTENQCVAHFISSTKDKIYKIISAHPEKSLTKSNTVL